jgi:hypothetical protein
MHRANWGPSGAGGLVPQTGGIMHKPTGGGQRRRWGHGKRGSRWTTQPAGEPRAPGLAVVVRGLRCRLGASPTTDPTLLPSTGPRRVTPATLSGTVRPHLASLSASDPGSQPAVTAINPSATRYTCHAQRNGLDSRSNITCALSLGARNWICEVNQARPQAVGVGCGDKTGAAAW